MPKPEASEREDEVLALVSAALSDGDRTVTLDSRPDRDQRSALTVDALLKVSEDCSEELWAADVCLASCKFDPRLPTAMNELRRMLLPSLEELARRAGRCVSVSCRVFVRIPGVSRREWQRMLLILDQSPPSYVEWINNTAPEPQHLGEMLAYVVADQKATLDAGVVVNIDDSVGEIYYRVGKRTAGVCPHCHHTNL